jgi:GTP cyclohydrolase I
MESRDSIFTDLFKHLGEDPQREGLLETPKRAFKAWEEWTSGYAIDPASLLKTFEDGSEDYDEMVTVTGIKFYSHCEHHMATIIGEATVSYIPNGRIVGLSKFARVVDAYAKRFQVQERMCTQIADIIDETLRPKGVGVWLAARHMCMESRGIAKPGAVTHTTALRGVIKHEPASRAEFMKLVDRNIQV